MKLDQQFVITINRELGSGGRTIGDKLAHRLGVPFYDKAVIQALKEKYELTTEETAISRTARHRPSVQSLSPRRRHRAVLAGAIVHCKSYCKGTKKSEK